MSERCPTCGSGLRRYGWTKCRNPWHDRAVQSPATPQEPEPYGPFFDPCGKCVTRTHCAHHDRCLAECVPADLRAARLAAVEEERDAFKAENGEVRRLAVKERAELAAFADRAEAERDRLKAAFLELHATVKGECPSLLDPDRGGSDVLWALCAAALTPQGQSTDGETR